VAQGQAWEIIENKSCNFNRELKEMKVVKDLSVLEAIKSNMDALRQSAAKAFPIS
jgi:hypothetical protein